MHRYTTKPVSCLTRECTQEKYGIASYHCFRKSAINALYLSTSFFHHTLFLKGKYVFLARVSGRYCLKQVFHFV